MGCIFLVLKLHNLNCWEIVCSQVCVSASDHPYGVHCPRLQEEGVQQDVCLVLLLQCLLDLLVLLHHGLDDHHHWLHIWYS